MAEMEAESVGLVLCDPPYGLEFMGKSWDRLGDVGQSHAGFSPGAPAEPGVRGAIRALPSYNASGNVRCRKCGRWKWGHRPGDGGGGGLGCQCEQPDFPNVKAMQGRQMQEWHRAWLEGAFRVLAPGGRAKVMGGSRTFHRLAAAMAQVGFTDITFEAWGYGSGFPKSLDVGKALDRMAGAEREVLVERTLNCNTFAVDGHSGASQEHHRKKPGGASITAPASDEAKLWDGWGTALKPAWEPVLVGTKPGRVAYRPPTGGT